MTVLIIGGGASGMAAALTAARAGHQVVLAERQARVGRKLLATGMSAGEILEKLK